jgi:hypothetical protein
MKTKRTHKVYWLAGLLLGGLVCLFASCEEEVGNRAPSEMLATELAVSCRPFGDDGETTARSAGAPRRRAETVEIPLEDRWVLAATLEEEEEVPVRAAGEYNELVNGARFMVVAYKKAAGSGYEPNPQVAEYVYNSMTGLLEKKAGATAIELTTGTYKYVYYSYNSASTVPSYNSSGGTISVTPYTTAATSNDLLWGESGDVAVGGAISVSLSHMFTRVRLRVSTSEATAASLSNVSATFETNHAGVFTVSTGKFSSSTATTAQALTLSGTHSISSTASAYSNYRLVHTAEQPSVAVKISGKIGTKTFSNRTLTFVGALAATKSYVLRIRLWKDPLWAGSNIYWDGSKLTFAPYGDTSKRLYQGVYFLWGSLVGIRPWCGSKTQGNVVYVPTYVASNASTSTWDDDEPDVFGYASSYDDLPSLYGTTTSDGPNVDYFAASSTADYANKKGDICRYLSATGAAPASYRMPTLYELVKGDNSGSITSGSDYGSWSSNQIGKWLKSNSNWASAFAPSQDAPAGTYPISVGATYNNLAFFPASYGFIYESSFLNAFYNGVYWSSSAYSGTTNAYNLNFDNSGLSVGNNDRRSTCSVRCVLNQ